MAEYYLLIKLLHILAAVVVTGTGAGIAFFMLMASRSHNPQAILMTTEHVILADWIFTTPAVIIQLTTGLMLMNILGYSFDAPWFHTVMSLFIFIGALWLPVIKIQYQLRTLAKRSTARGKVTDEFKTLMKKWIILGIPAFAAIMVIFYLMVFKPMALY
jgi:uncharacterized membrane protein